MHEKNNKSKSWIRKNITNILFGAFALTILFVPQAKSWFIRQVASTGIMNASLKEKGEFPAADFSSVAFTDGQGKNYTLGELQGKVVFINFWASWCPPCRAEFPSIEKFYSKYKEEENLVFLTVNMDQDPALGKAYLEKEHLSVPFVLPGGDIPSELFEGALPTTLLLDKEGTIRMRHTGAGDYSKSSFYSKVEQLLRE
ncbi:TlpA family protein disulfide reductase [Planobacterium oryzisoli]|uniref:TlpA family protein disulfide reductase n=1 Tax=Planobacterium oryzisoli TaxID=2771435 RepID=A0A930YU21_9FLAO|nr:TlpA disulfide reductase family protein [Planobacterium oryzisoli]MBF5026365.1 TlpA family protein disulfide reductase [Planobacterium oryzisoli]